jgi:hypothetical protein
VALFAASAAFFMGCGAASSPQCACLTDPECGEGKYCENCRCVARCESSGDCPDDTPNCDPDSGRCQAPCPEYECPADRPNCGSGGVCVGPCTDSADCTHPDVPNCGSDGLCFGPCTGHDDCTNPAYPNCDPSTGICRGPCPSIPCPPDLPNCGEDGLCFAPCTEAADCPASMPNCDTARGICFGACASGDDCIDPSYPNCDPATGLCQGPCPDVPCPEGMVNCTSGGICYGACASGDDCIDPSYPNCDPATGLCQGPCPGTPCPEGMVNCTSGGICFGPCTSAADCIDAAKPNCGPGGVCFAPCVSNADCIHPDFPNCDGGSGLCFGPCSDGGDCLDPAAPNCGPDGLCFGPCSSRADCVNPAWPNCDSLTGTCFGPCAAHADCIDAALPNCDLDPSGPTAGICLPPCAVSGDCASALYPNCDPTPGVCLPPCTGDSGCPEEAWKCDTASGLCFLPGCVVDTDCSPPATVCEDWTCVPGCDDHGDCLPGERCNLVGPDTLNHCEPRDCLSDADCTAPGTVCDTDGLVDPDGGGYCVDGCVTFYDCRQQGYGCDAGTGRCSPRDYGDIGADCSAGCRSGFCLAAEGNLCTGFCCIQHDCPAGWGCRPHDDGTGSGGTVDVCVPLDPSHGMRDYNEICLNGNDCRSGICAGSRCRETCCTDEDCDQPFVSLMYCGLSGMAGVTACYNEPTVGNNPLGTPGCSTTGDPGDCRSNLCFTYYISGAGCAGGADCPPERPTCWDLDADGSNDCVRDFCVDHCCSERDCPDYGSDRFACSKWLYGSSDFDICLLFEGTGTLQEGQACTSNAECRSMVCSESLHICRARCCTDADCLSPLYPRCALEQNHVFSTPRLLNVCLP